MSTGIGDSVAVFGARDAKLLPLISDPPGGLAVYGSAIDVPGITDLQLDTDIMSAEAEGDDETVAVASRIKSIKGKLGMTLESLPVFQTILGGVLTNLGATPNQTSEWLNSKGDRGQKFMLIVQSSGDDDSPFSYMDRTFYKCTLTKFTNGSGAGKFSGPGIDFTAISRRSDGKRWDFKLSETGADLTLGPVDTTPPTVTSSTPANAGTLAALAGVVSFTYSKAMDSGTVSDQGTYYYSDALTGAGVPFAVTVAGTTVTLTPLAPVTTTRKYDIGVTRAAKDLAGNRLAAGYGIAVTAP
jgi:hypothetical protein